MKRIYLLTIEGADGTGKTTIVQKLKEVVENSYVDLLVTKAPYSNGVFYSELTSVRPSQWYSPRRLAMMWALNHHDHNDYIHKFFKNANDDAVVIADRGPMSSVVYNATGGVTTEEIYKLHEGLRYPHLTIMLDAPVAILEQRIRERNAQESEYESNLQQVQDNYHHAFTHYQLAGHPIALVQADGGIEETLNGVLNRIANKSPRWVQKAFGTQL